MREERDPMEGGGYDTSCDRRQFLTAMGAATGSLAVAPAEADGVTSAPQTPVKKHAAVVRMVFVYPPSRTFAENPDGWWSWPGNEFDAEGHQRTYTAALTRLQNELNLTLVTDGQPVATKNDAQRVAREIQANPPDGLLVIMFYNRSLREADLLLQTAEQAGIPAIFFIGLGVKHGPVAQYRRPGLYLIQSLDNLDAIAYGLRMIATRTALSQSTILSINDAKESREEKEQFFGITVRVIPFARYAAAFKRIPIDAAARQFIKTVTGGATEIRRVSREAVENAARAHLALKKLLAAEHADGLTMNCLTRGMLKPCISFATLNSDLIPAACENDLPAVYTQLLGQHLLGRPGFQHNPCFETERNHYYASHCTCAPKLYGPNGPARPYLLRRFAHTNNGSCAIQVFWNPGDPVTMVHYYPGTEPTLDVYAGKVVASHPMPPAAGCTTNVEIEITDRPDACMVKGHHNLLFCGDDARKLRLFAQLFKLKLADTGFTGPWPV